MLRYLPLILKNCWRNRRRTLLTIASIGVSMCLLGVMMSMYHAFYLSAPAPDEALRLVVRNRVSLTVAIPLAYQSRIKQIPGVREAMIGNWFGGTYKDNRDPKNMFARFAVEPEKLFTVYGEIRIPDEEKKAFIRDRTGCVIGRDIAKTHGFKVGDRIPIIGDIYPGNFEFTVRGIFDWPRASDVMYFNKEYVDQSIPERRRGAVGLYYVLIDDPDHSGRIASAIDAEFRNSTSETKTETEQAFTVGFLSLLGNVKMFLIAISGAGDIHDPAGLREYDGDVRSRARARGRRSEDARIRTRRDSGPDSGRGLFDFDGGRTDRVPDLHRLDARIAKSPIGGFLPALPLIEPGVATACIATAGIVGLLSSLVPALGASRMSIVQALRSSD